MGTGGLISFIWGLLFFNEALTSIVIAITGILFLTVGISLVASTAEDRGSSSFKGIILAIAAGLIFGCYLVPLKLSKL
jgi:drug/metabolite transporter (DMT)-like permease